MVKFLTLQDKSAIEPVLRPMRRHRAGTENSVIRDKELNLRRSSRKRERERDGKGMWQGWETSNISLREIKVRGTSKANSKQLLRLYMFYIIYAISCRSSKTERHVDTDK